MFRSIRCEHLLTWMWRTLILLLFGVTLVPHHHHSHEDVCVRMDWVVHSHAEASSAPVSAPAECDSCCGARFLTYRPQKEQQAAAKPILLFSLLIASGFLRIRHLGRAERKPAWRVRKMAFVPDDYFSSPFGWRAPPFLN